MSQAESGAGSIRRTEPMYEAQLLDMSSVVTRQQNLDPAGAPVLTPAAPVSFEPVTRARAAIHGKFLVAGGQKLYVRGVTYGPYRPDADGNEYHDLESIERDFTAMMAICF